MAENGCYLGERERVRERKRKREREREREKRGERERERDLGCLLYSWPTQHISRSI